MDSMDRIRKVEITVEAVVTSDEVDPDELAMLEEVDSYGNRGVAPKTEDEINDFMYRNRKLIHAVLRTVVWMTTMTCIKRQPSGSTRGLRHMTLRRESS